MTLAEKIVAALIMKDETIATLEAEIEVLKADAQELEKVREYFDADVPASVEPVAVIFEPLPELIAEQTSVEMVSTPIVEKLPDWATPPDHALVPVQIDVPVSM